MSDIISSILPSKIIGLVIYVKIIFIIISLIFLAGIVFLLLRNSWFKRRFLEDLTEFFIYRPFGVKKEFKRWAKIIKRLEAKSESDYKLAVIEADNLLDEVLKKIGHKGETMAERLGKIDSKTFPNLEEVWQAHKARNNIVHSPDYRITEQEAKKLVGIYEQALRNLEMF